MRGAHMWPWRQTDLSSKVGAAAEHMGRGPHEPPTPADVSVLCPVSARVSTQNQGEGPGQAVSQAASPHTPVWPWPAVTWLRCQAVRYPGGQGPWAGQCLQIGDGERGGRLGQAPAMGPVRQAQGPGRAPGTPLYPLGGRRRRWGPGSHVAGMASAWWSRPAADDIGPPLPLSGHPCRRRAHPGPWCPAALSTVGEPGASHSALPRAGHLGAQWGWGPCARPPTLTPGGPHPVCQAPSCQPWASRTGVCGPLCRGNSRIHHAVALQVPGLASPPTRGTKGEPGANSSTHGTRASPRACRQQWGAGETQFCTKRTVF